MKRFFQNSCSWLAMLFTCVAFAISSSVSAQDVTFKLDASANPNSDVQTKTAKGVTINYHQYGGVGNLYSYDWPFNFSSTNGNIVKIKLVTNENLNDIYVATGEWSASSSTWTGSTTNLTIETTGDHYVTEAQVWLENGGNGEGGGEEGGNEGGEISGDYMVVSSVSPAEGEVSTDNGLHYFTIYFEENFGRNLTTWEGHPVPEGITFTNSKGESVPIDASGFTTWAGSNQMNITISYGVYEPETYTLHVPAGINYGESGRPNPELNLTWTLVTPSTPDVPEPVGDLSKFVGNYHFHGNNPFIEGTDDNLAPKTDYDCQVSIANDHLIMTGLVGEVWDWPYYYTGTYYPESNVIVFSADGSYIVDENWEYYIANNDIYLNIAEEEDGTIRLYNNDGWQFLYEDWSYSRFATGYNGLIEFVKEGGEEGPEVPDTPDADLSKFVGDYLFHGVGAYNNDPYTSIVPEEYYEVSIEAVDGELRMTGLLGDVFADPSTYQGTYNANSNTVTFNVPKYWGYGYVMVTDYDYYTINDPLVLNVVEDEKGNIKLVNNEGWNFFFGWDYYKAGYATSVEFVKGGEVVVEWDGTVNFPETATSIDDLLNLTIEFENAEEAIASNHDVLGAIYDTTGNPYAIIMGNETYSVFGDVASESNKITVNFVKIADLNNQLQNSARNIAARIGGYQAGNGSATVVFAGKSFKVDGKLVDNVISHEYNFAGDLATGIDAIATESNGSIFDLSGRRVVNTTNGLYIVGGRKVIK